MRHFLAKTAKLILIYLITLVLLIAATTFYCRKAIDLKLPASKNTVIAGDSHTECAIDDKLIPYSINISQSGTAYFYTYVKLREIIARNTQIDTVVLGYSYDDVSTQKDAWFNGDESIKFKIRNYLFLFSFRDYMDLLKSNPLSVIMHTPQVIFHNLKIRVYGLSTLGGYLPLERSKLEESIKKHREGASINLTGSVYHEFYLLKIYDLCQSNGIQLVLLNPPLHPILQKDQEQLKAAYEQLARTKLSSAILVDHANVKIPDYGFSDLSHLNKKGSEIYSNILKLSGFVWVN